MISCQYRKSHCGDKTILRPSYLHNGISYTGNTTSLYWIRAQYLTELGKVYRHPIHGHNSSSLHGIPHHKLSSAILNNVVKSNKTLFGINDNDTLKNIWLILCLWVNTEVGFIFVLLLFMSFCREQYMYVYDMTTLHWIIWYHIEKFSQITSLLHPVIH